MFCHRFPRKLPQGLNAHIEGMCVVLGSMMRKYLLAETRVRMIPKVGKAKLKPD